MNPNETIWLVFFPITGRGTIPLSDQKKVFDIDCKRTKSAYLPFPTPEEADKFKHYGGGKAVIAYKVYTITGEQFNMIKRMTEEGLLEVLTDNQKCGWTYFGNVSKL